MFVNRSGNKITIMMKRQYSFWLISKIKLFAAKHCFYKLVGFPVFIPGRKTFLLFYNINYLSIKREFFKTYQKYPERIIFFSIYISVYCSFFRIKKCYKLT